MKTINVTFEDNEFKLLEIAKSGMTWREYILNTSKRRKTNKANKPKQRS